MAVTTAVLDDATTPVITSEKAPEGRVSKIFSPRGRIGVRTYLARCTLASLPLMVAVIVVGATVHTEQSTGTGSGLSPVEYGVMVPAAAVILMSFFYMLMMAIRRLHDLNMSAWYYLVSLMPVVGGFFALYMTFAPGKTEPNKYGEFHEPSSLDKIAGGFVIGLLALALVVLAAATIFGMVAGGA